MEAELLGKMQENRQSLDRVLAMVKQTEVPATGDFSALLRFIALFCLGYASLCG